MSRMSSEYLLVKYDVSGIQDYIFASNRLRENAGASYQVTRILGEYLEEVFRKTAAEWEVKIDLNWNDGGELHLLEDQEIMAEIVYSGGGNTVAVFRDVNLFRKVGEALAYKTAVNSQGLQVVVAYIETDLIDFAKDRKALDQKMAGIKRSMMRQPLYSPFPVVEQDPVSHQPITCRLSYRDTTENVTRIQSQKRNAYNQIRSFQNLFPNLPGSYDYPEDMERLCRVHGEDSRIAVVHIDGNGMGERINSLVDGHRGYSAGVSAIRRESVMITGLFRDTYAQVLRDLWDDQIFADGSIFPLRPIILDGDDFTFLCRAELAVPVAAGFMLKLMQNQPQGEPKITACGGIAFVHSHFPFSVAYSIAEESCSRAKKAWYEMRAGQQDENTACYLDFQVIKENETEVSTGDRRWQQRPYLICQDQGETNENTLHKLHALLERMQDWPSGRLQKIYQAFQRDDQTMELLKREFHSRGYSIDELNQGDWKNSALFDALELQRLCRVDLLEKLLNTQ